MRHRLFVTSVLQLAYRSLYGRQLLNSGLNESASVKLLLLASVALFAAAPAFAQDYAPRQTDTTGSITQIQPNTTGNDVDTVTSYGATGADTVNSDSAAGGNANQPSRAIPNGSAGGGSGGSN